jgi:Fe-S cluster biogenesis protein NfuA
LGNLSDESFTKKDWEKITKRHFSGKCAYCGKKWNTIDHAIPINRIQLGENRIGNLVPACKSCNASKSDKNYKDFIAALKNEVDNPEEKSLFDKRIEKIEQYMKERDYCPLSNHPLKSEVQNKLQEAYDEIASIAEEYIKEIKDLFSK